MSADNGIYILETGAETKEWRVEHLQAVENVSWDSRKNDFTDDADVQIENARKLWGRSRVFLSEDEALKEAYRQLKETYICEYGISTIMIPRDF